MDIKLPEDRSKNMAAIKSRNTKPEMLLRKALFHLGLRYLVRSKLTGKPDIVFTRQKVAVFVDGCFWHGCPKCYKEPEQNRDFWRKKIESNRLRDNYVNNVLTQEGWKVVRVWEHDIKKDLNTVVQKILKCVAITE